MVGPPATASFESALAAVAGGTIVVLVGAVGRRRFAVAPRRPHLDRADRTAVPVGRRPVLATRRATAIGLLALVAVAFSWHAAAVAIISFLAVRRGRPLVESRRQRRIAHRAFPDAVERIVLLVHAGLTPHLAVRAATSSVPTAIRPAFETVVHRLDRGLPLAEALTALPTALGPRAAALADAFGAADRYGLPLEPMLDQLAQDARAERRRFDEADARRLPVRLAFPLVSCTLPAFVLIAIAPAVIAALSSLGASTW